MESPEDFIGFLDHSNWDLTRITRARTELGKLKMGEYQEWNTFFPSWSNKLTEGRGDMWPDETKITMLRGALNKTLRKALASNHLLPQNDFFAWTKIVGQISHQHEEIDVQPNRSGGWVTSEGLDRSRNNQSVNGLGRREVGHINRGGKFNAGWRPSNNTRRIVGEVDTAGDTFMGGVNSANVARGANGKPLRARWKSPDQIQRLQREGKCFRYERQGCSTRVCPVLPARKPGAVGISASPASLPAIDLRLLMEDEDENEALGQYFSEN